ncbi:uncharacterized protein GGS25DRAFT_524791 [Hypoxylon fragiforme]|uniref:uncharacterized protein n=1 Tax=Hypoxylon fragiforme TaxID=63214 RepID=UPI0020C6C78A|nr:uncharacterized protein GGS25DRAFT_524791 [Hypoxylon fragiforme]KAI2605272.1 hypothetical protein GGS25DRAFT_524791 [Hypoxylon fragiforme]
MAKHQYKHCSKCEERIRQDPLPELVLMFADPYGWGGEAEGGQKLGIRCTECQLSTEEGAIEAVQAVAHAPAELFTQDVLLHLLVELGHAGRLVVHPGWPMIWNEVIKAVYWWRSRVQLADVSNTVSIIAGREWAITFLQRLAQHALSATQRQIHYYNETHGGGGGGSSSRNGEERIVAGLAGRTCQITTPQEVQDYFDFLDVRVNSSRFRFNQNLPIKVGFGS